MKKSFLTTSNFKKFALLIAITGLTVGCSSNSSKEQMLFEAAQACEQICKNHPNISQVSSAAGAGIPLLFAGGMETSCECQK